jgi:hypothetical protein
MRVPLFNSHPFTLHPRVRIARIGVARALTCLGCITAAVVGHAFAAPAPNVIVRVYNAFGFANRDVREAVNAANALIDAADIHVSWRQCWKDRGALQQDMHVCGDTLEPGELIVRLVTDPSASSGRVVSLGYSLVVGEGGSTLATVYGNRVTELSKLAHADLPTVLGRAMAHEIGHLLLGTNEHSSHGLMRAYWSAASVHAGGEWSFASREAEYMRANALARTTTTPDQLMAAVSIIRVPFRFDVDQ